MPSKVVAQPHIISAPHTPRVDCGTNAKMSRRPPGRRAGVKGGGAGPAGFAAVAQVRKWPITPISQFSTRPLLVETDMTGLRPSATGSPHRL
jgi:hypothetical protein